MKNPVIAQYQAVYKKYYGRLEESEAGILHKIRMSIDNPEEIMGINWVSMGEVLGVPSSFFARVYNGGWYCCEDAKILRRHFEDLIKGCVLHKSLEDYL